MVVWKITKIAVIFGIGMTSGVLIDQTVKISNIVHSTSNFLSRNNMNNAVYIIYYLGTIARVKLYKV